MSSELLTQGFELMLVGMGTVFVFLTALVCATTLMSHLISRFSAAPAAETPAVTSDDDEIAAITAAITLHRRNRR